MLERERAAELERGSALPRDHVRVVERRHERRASLGGEPRRDRLPVVALAVVENDLGAVSARARRASPAARRAA